MARNELKPFPPFIKALDSSIVTYHAALDQQTLAPAKPIWCWFCYQSRFAVWWYEGAWTLRCVGNNSCGTYYVAWSAGVPSFHDGLRVRCKCQGTYFKVKPAACKCLKCGAEQATPNLWVGWAALLEPEPRLNLREAGYLQPTAAGGGPTYHRAKNPDPWQPRVDLLPQVLRRRLALYRRREIAKLEAGLEVTRDYRTLRGKW